MSEAFELKMPAELNIEPVWVIPLPKDHVAEIYTHIDMDNDGFVNKHTGERRVINAVVINKADGTPPLLIGMPDAAAFAQKHELKRFLRHWAAGLLAFNNRVEKKPALGLEEILGIVGKNDN